MTRKTQAPEEVEDEGLDAAQGGILTTNENITEWKRETSKVRLERNASTWGDATGHFD